ncbi:hypothetical protein [Desulfovibrio sp.]|uniref:hypothetical protein n=1 Tax=Desulfovibrio sp. TaxID=885 RepID=UPI0025C71C6C|nr:hypothetical protein [Desulfovibrio sp.]
MHSEFFNAPGVSGSSGVSGAPATADRQETAASGASATAAASGMPQAPSYLGSAHGHGNLAKADTPPPASAASGSNSPDGAATQPDTPRTGQTEQPSGQENAERQFEQRLLQHEAARREQWQGQVSQWRQEVAQDPHMGGANMAASVARAQLALDRFDQGKHIGRLLEESGYGNHPEVLRFFNRMADALMEDSLVRGEPGGGMPPLEERMYAGWSSKK